MFKTGYELAPGYYQTVSKSARYVPSCKFLSHLPFAYPSYLRVLIAVKPLLDADDTCLPCWSKYDNCFRNANPVPSTLPSSFFTKELQPSATLEPPVNSCLRDTGSWKRLEHYGYTRPKRSVAFGGEEVREYHSDFGVWKPKFVGQDKYRSAEKAKVMREQAMFDLTFQSQTLQVAFVNRFQAVQRYMAAAKPQPVPDPDKDGLVLVQRLRLSEKLLRQFQENDGKLHQELSSQDPLYLSDYWNPAFPAPQPEPIVPVPRQPFYGNGTFFLDTTVPLPRTITEADIFMHYGEHNGILVGNMFCSSQEWIDVSISEP